MTKRRKKWNGARFVAIDHPVLDSNAFKALSGPAKSVVLLLHRRWSGTTGNNNGRIPLAVREVQAWCHCSYDKARKIMAELVASRIAVPTRVGGFTRKVRHSTEWELAYLPTAQREPSWAFKKAEAQNQSPEHGTEGGFNTEPRVGSEGAFQVPKKPFTGPRVGSESINHGTEGGFTCKVPSVPHEQSARPGSESADATAQLASGIRNARKALRWSQVRLAAAARTHQPIVSKIERGDLTKVGPATVRRVAQAVGVSA